MKTINLEEDFRIKNGISIYQVLKSLYNENNFTDEDWEYEFPKRRRKYYLRDYKKH